MIKRIEKYQYNSAIALISDAGSPLISDPGYNLIQDYIKKNLYVTTIPGPSSILSSLQLSGLPINNFEFFGFVSKNKSSMNSQAKKLQNVITTSVFFISGNRLINFLKILLDAKINRKIAVCKELTKKNEWVFRGYIKKIIDEINIDKSNLKGEFTLLIQGKERKTKITIQTTTEAQIKKLLKKFSLTEVVEIVHRLKDLSKKEIYKELEKNTPNKFLVIADAFRNKININKIYKKTKVDMWFLKQIKEIIDVENILIKFGIPKNTNEMNYVKSIGFGDEKIAKLTKISAESVKNLREKLNVLSVYKKIDTCAAEFKSLTPYMYSTYQRDAVGSSICESKPTGKKKIIILGGGPNRIGQGIEFDYCCCQASYALKESGYETIMINCNPETVSTDYDTSDRLYFEPLVEEYVINIIKKEQSNGNLLGIITQLGGQTPIKLAKALDQNRFPILGTQYSSIDLAENRERFKNLLNKDNFKQAESGIAKSKKEAINITKSLGYPVVIRPSYVLGGRAMEIIHNENQLNKYIDEAIKVSGSNPVLIDKFLNDAIEVDVDAIADGEKVFVAGIMEHIEEAGIHSGDSACSVPPYSLKKEIIDEIESQTTRLAIALEVVGLINIQFAIKDNEIYVLEVNPRASRTVPFISKAIGIPIAKIAARVMTGEKIEKFNLKKGNKNTFAIKEAVFPFNKFPDVDVLLGPEMKSTGEVMGIDKNFGLSFAKSQMACGNSLPVSGTAFISVKDKDKKNALDFAKKLKGLNFKLCATSGTAKYLNSNGIHCKKINKVRDGSPHIVESLNAKNIELVINTTEGTKSVGDSYSLRRSALINKIPYCTTLAAANACIQAIDSLKNNEIKVKAIQEL